MMSVSEVTRNNPSASMTIVFFMVLASAMSALTVAMIAGSLPSPGPITRLCSLENQGKIALLVSVASVDLNSTHKQQIFEKGSL